MYLTLDEFNANFSQKELIMPPANERKRAIPILLAASFVLVLGACASTSQTTPKQAARIIAEPVIAQYALRYSDRLPAFQVAQNYSVSVDGQANRFQLIGLYDPQGFNLGYKLKFDVTYKDEGFRSYETSLVQRSAGPVMRTIEPLSRQRNCLTEKDCLYQETGLIDISDFAVKSAHSPIVITSVQLVGPGLPVQEFTLNQDWVVDLDAEAKLYLQTQQEMQPKAQSAKESPVAQAQPSINEVNVKAPVLPDELPGQEPSLTN
jgi:hypothetical protein